MHHFINIIQEKEFTQEHIDVALWHSAVGLLESETRYTTFENVDGNWMCPMIVNSIFV